MKEIALTQGKSAIVDDDVYEYLMQYKWCAMKGGRTYYAVRGVSINSKQRLILMHRVIMELCVGKQSEMVVDHRDHNGLNNTRENIHYVTHRQNIQNNINNNSGFPGVSYVKREKKFQATARFNGGRHHLGYFHLPEDAYQAYRNFLDERGIL